MSILDNPLFTTRYHSSAKSAIERIKDDSMDLEMVEKIIEDVLYSSRQQGHADVHKRIYPLIEYFLIKFRALHDHIADLIMVTSDLPNDVYQRIGLSFPTLYRYLNNPRKDSFTLNERRRDFDLKAVDLVKSIQEDYLKSFNYLRNRIIHHAANIEVAKVTTDEIYFSLVDAVTEKELDSFPYYIDKANPTQIEFSTLYKSEVNHLNSTLKELEIITR